MGTVDPQKFPLIRVVVQRGTHAPRGGAWGVMTPGHPGGARLPWVFLQRGLRGMNSAKGQPARKRKDVKERSQVLVIDMFRKTINVRAMTGGAEGPAS